LVLVMGCSDDGLAPPPLDDEGAGSGPETSGTGTNGDSAVDGGATGSPETGGVGDGGSTGSAGGTTGADEGETGGSDGTTGGAELICIDETQCMLIDDCCTCAAVHVDGPVEECELDCKTTMCESLGIPDIGVVCDPEGACMLEPRNCADGVVSCDMATPRCPEGTLPEVTEQGDCWTGACIPVEACDGVPSCEWCGEDEVCVEELTQLGSLFSCQPRPDDCGGVPTCACVPEACEEPFGLCGEAEDHITCSCPVC